jgi:hypothetical protein
VGGGFLGDVWSSDKGGQAMWCSEDQQPLMSSALYAVSAATRNRGSVWDRVVKQKRAADMWARLG